MFPRLDPGMPGNSDFGRRDAKAVFPHIPDILKPWIKITKSGKGSIILKNLSGQKKALFPHVPKPIQCYVLCRLWQPCLCAEVWETTDWKDSANVKWTFSFFRSKTFHVKRDALLWSAKYQRRGVGTRSVIVIRSCCVSCVLLRAQKCINRLSGQFWNTACQGSSRKLSENETQLQN